MESNTVVTRLLELARLDPKYLADLEKLRRTIAVMFTDIHGSTAYFEKHGDAVGLLLLHECNSMILSAVERHGGRVIKTIGDGTLATFDDCGEAVRAAIEMQREISAMNALRKPDEQTGIRIGVHYGTSIVKSNDVFGDAVNVASRVESVALPGQIVVSDQVRQHIEPAGFKPSELGRFNLKGKAEEQVLFEVPWKEEAPTATTVGTTTGPVETPVATNPTFKLQVIRNDGSTGAEYLLKSTLTIGRSEGDIRFPSDAMMAPLHARIVLEDSSAFVEDISQGRGSIFLRLSAAYTLQDGDIIIMGNHAIRFCENHALLAAVTVVGATLQDLSRAVENVAEFVQLGAGAAGKRYPLRSEEVQFGRTKGTYCFPEDKLMSRLHARVLQRGADFVVEDAGSRNGTFVQVRGRALLPVGSALLVGSRLLRLVEHS